MIEIIVLVLFVWLWLLLAFMVVGASVSGGVFGWILLGLAVLAPLVATWRLLRVVRVLVRSPVAVECGPLS